MDQLSVPSIRRISKCTIKPEHILEESKQPCYLTPWDVTMLSADYVQEALFYPKPTNSTIASILDQLKHSLSQTLTHFSPLAGRFKTTKFDNPPSCAVHIDSIDTPGANFIHASINVSMSDVLGSIDISPIVDSLFAIDKAINHDGHHVPLLGVQVTELVDGIVIGVATNHVVTDGYAFWHFFNTWCEISNGGIECISRPPVIKRWFIDGYDHVLKLPIANLDEYVQRPLRKPFRARMFHFSHQTILQLKAKANAECNKDNISCFQALIAHIWRAVTRARCLPVDQYMICLFASDERLKLDPQLPSGYFGNCILGLNGGTTAGELLKNNLGWSAMLLHQPVVAHNNLEIRAVLQALMKTPFVYLEGALLDQCIIMIGGSPRFDVYGNDFGWGKPIAIRSGSGNKFEGRINLYPGCEGERSVDVELSLLPEVMSELESDKDFMASVSPTKYI